LLIVKKIINMALYKITITPLQYYFFGGEKHDEDLKVNYFVESLDYPQQTTILGALRYILLLHKNLLGGKSLAVDKQQDANDLIGPESFEYEVERSFGKIESISPLYFTDGKNDYHFAPSDFKFEMNDNFVLNFENERYNAKKHESKLGGLLIPSSGKEVHLSDIIQNIVQVGNEKAEIGGTKEEAFYKQTLKKLNEGWSFAVNAKIDLELDKLSFKIPFGGEKNISKVDFEEVKNIQDFSLPDSYKRNKPFIYCLSDCFIDDIDIETLPFTVTDFVSFRNLRSKTSTKNYYALKKDKKKDNIIADSLVRSNHYQLLKRGSVLYFDSQVDCDCIGKKIEENLAKTVGFNHILIKK